MRRKLGKAAVRFAKRLASPLVKAVNKLLLSIGIDLSRRGRLGGRDEKTFVFEAMEMPVWDDPMMDMPMEEPKPEVPWNALIAGAAVLAAAGLVIRKKRSKKKMHEQLEMDEE